MSRLCVCFPQKPNVIALQETKAEKISELWVEKVWGCHDFKYALKKSKGNSGGIITIWDHNMFNANLVVERDSFIAIKGFWKDVGGRTYTRISDNGRKFSKLDRYLVSENLIIQWPNLNVTVLDKKHTDHCPLILQDGDVDFSPKPVKVFDEWLKQEDSYDIIKSTWNKITNSVKLYYIFRDKLKLVKQELRKWYSTSHGKLKTKIEDLTCAGLFQKNTSKAWMLNSWDGRKIKSESPEALENRFTETEILEAIKGTISNGCNASFITLIPKVNDPLNFSNYRPISLIGSYYKIPSKILANRNRKIIPRLIGDEQSAFISSRYILDGVLIALESIDDLKSTKQKSFIFKVDFEKAFDCLDWDFS
ncbi:uncharacterized protein [Rutidosis leptorrhynchoides]|uniref:uncharacterized protein n=1 Tax=Rutidosis leptorrhynchoides TaxID=125765 RepID=UPI003A9A2CEC